MSGAINGKQEKVMEHVDALAAGTHDIVIDGIRQRYHVAGRGPVCLVHSGGPGIEPCGYVKEVPPIRAGHLFESALLALEDSVAHGHESNGPVACRGPDPIARGNIYPVLGGRSRGAFHLAIERLHRALSGAARARA